MSKILIAVHIALTAAVFVIGGLKLIGHDPLALTTEHMSALGLLYLTTLGSIFLIREFRAALTETAIKNALAAHLGPYVEEAHVMATVHEKDFYAALSRQVREANVGVDITNLTARPPSLAGKQEAAYFKEFAQMVGATKAVVRRVERLTKHKVHYVQELIDKMKGRKNFSLAVFVDPFDGAEPNEMSIAVSMQRVDNRFAWIVALAEHNAASKPVRDIMLTGKDSVELVGVYFERLWSRSTVVIKEGEVVKGGWDDVQRGVQPKDNR